MPYKSLAELMLSMETKRHIKSKKKRIRKKHRDKIFWTNKLKEQENALDKD
jgi:hypothetical protein